MFCLFGTRHNYDKIVTGFSLVSVWRLNYQIFHWGLNWKDPKVQIWHQQVKISLCLLAAGLLTKREKAVYSFQMHHCIHSGGVQYGGQGLFCIWHKVFSFLICTKYCSMYFHLYRMHWTLHIRACDICTTGGSVLCQWGFTAYRNILSLCRRHSSTIS